MTRRKSRRFPRQGEQPIPPRPAALGTVKGNFGHTKAAAGVAGLIKAALAVHHQVVPPATGHRTRHPALASPDSMMYVPTTAELWPGDQPVRAGVSAMGFGGINTHIALDQAPETPRRTRLDDRTLRLVSGRQDAELLLLDGDSLAALAERIRQLTTFVGQLAYAELTDLAAVLADELSDRPVRAAAVVVASPEQALEKLTALLVALESGVDRVLDADNGVFLARGTTRPRIAFLFPGQGSGHGAVGAIRRRIAAAEDIFTVAGLSAGADQVATEVAQPRIVTGSLAALRVLGELGIEGQVAVGHSLGELSALHWAAAMTEGELLRLAGIRGRVMATASRGGGAMAGLLTGERETMRLIGGDAAVIAGYNSPQQTVISGASEAVDRVCAAATAAGVSVVRLRVSHAFHSPLVEPAAVAMGEPLAGFDFAELARPVVSTVTGDLADPRRTCGRCCRHRFCSRCGLPKPRPARPNEPICWWRWDRVGC